MSKKKSRKAGLIGVRKDPDFKKKRPSLSVDRKSTKTNGKPAGSRNSIQPVEGSGSIHNQSKDPRLGSKKPIELIKTKTEQQPKPKEKQYFSPAQELDAIENDKQLSSILDKVDTDEKISREQQQYMNAKLARHKVLCELLGIAEEEPEAKKTDEPQDLYQQFENSNLDDYK